MLTPKQNMLEVIRGGNPDRFVNQYEAVQLLFHPFMFANPLLEPPSPRLSQLPARRANLKANKNRFAYPLPTIQSSSSYNIPKS